MFHIDYQSGIPIYEQVYRAVVKLGAAGAFGESGQLPSVRTVAQELGVNPNTVQKAYALLERDGILISLPGKGSFLKQVGDLREKRRRESLEQLRQAAANCLECGASPEEARQTLEEALRGPGKKEGGKSLD